MYNGFYRPRGSKYGARKITTDDGSVFDSIKEYRRWQTLKALETDGQIFNLKRQVKYVLIPAQREPDTVGPKGGIKKGKVIERECAYIADFVYDRPDAEGQIVEDTKGMRTKDYTIKRKLMLYVHGIRIKEV